MGANCQWVELTVNPLYGRSVTVRLQRQLKLNFRPTIHEVFPETSHPGKRSPGKRLSGKVTIRESSFRETSYLGKLPSGKRPHTENDYRYGKVMKAVLLTWKMHMLLTLVITTYLFDWFSCISWGSASAVQLAEFCVPFGTSAHSIVSQAAVAVCSILSEILSRESLYLMFLFTSVGKNTPKSLWRDVKTTVIVRLL